MAKVDGQRRRIETTIAYIGPPGGGKTTNVVLLGELFGVGDERREPAGSGAISWMQCALVRSGRFRGWEVGVRVVTCEGDVPVDRVAEVLLAADGVVIVVDGNLERLATTRAWVAEWLPILARNKESLFAMVVQVNKVDAADSIDAQSVMAELGLATWAHVPASAAEGRGVEETLCAAVEKVIEAMPDGTVDAPVPVTALNVESLTAVVRAAVERGIAEQLHAAEQSMVMRLDARIAQLELRLEQVLAELAARPL